MSTLAVIPAKAGIQLHWTAGARKVEVPLRISYGRAAAGLLALARINAPG